MFSFHFYAFFKKLQSWFRFNCLAYKGISSPSAVLNPGWRESLGKCFKYTAAGAHPKPNETETQVLESGPQVILCAAVIDNHRPGSLQVWVKSINPIWSGFFSLQISHLVVTVHMFQPPLFPESFLLWCVFTCTLRKSPCKSALS